MAVLQSKLTYPLEANDRESVRVTQIGGRRHRCVRRRLNLYSGSASQRSVDHACCRLEHSGCGELLLADCRSDFRAYFGPIDGIGGVQTIPLLVLLFAYVPAAQRWLFTCPIDQSRRSTALGVAGLLVSAKWRLALFAAHLEGDERVRCRR